MRHGFLEQEHRYQRLRASGKAVDHAGESFEHFNLRPFLEQVLPCMKFANSSPRALEYGTGTGPGACFLAARGFQVDAIDISPTAIELAKTFAAQRHLEIHYEVQDICNFSSQGRVYDLVVDNFCLQRLVADERRRKAFEVVQGLLNRVGYFVIGTTTYREERELRAVEIFDEQTGIVYQKLPAGSHRFEDCETRNGELVYPRVRRVRPEALRAELEQAGFCILRQDGGRVLCQIAPVDRHPKNS